MPTPADRSFSEIINARGVFTPLGVSRSPKEVSDAAAEALSRYFVMGELHDAVGQHIADSTGAPAATVVHCVASAITLAVAACITGTNKKLIERLPFTSGLKNRVVLPRPHAVNYGQPIEQAVKLAGAEPVLTGTLTSCSEIDIDEACSRPNTCCLLLVSSRLTTTKAIDFEKAVSAAHRHGVPAIIDGAAQDFRLTELLDTGADAVLISGQKYLGAPTSGLVLGQPDLISAVRAQENGIGRGMKASKEALLGVSAAVELRKHLNVDNWVLEQRAKVSRFVAAANEIENVTAQTRPDPTNLPFERAHLRLVSTSDSINAAKIAGDLRTGSPSIWVMDHLVEQSEIVFELVQLTDGEVNVIIKRLRELMSFA
ncbi:PLP-dependent transferase [Ruegeria sp. ANG10]|uniref:aminotransferase class V-fold PLP-dependent enzyme n=1 Tax=Ruegeria sp. ANG10 TaxID=3042467 RepID=UPI00345440C5